MTGGVILGAVAAFAIAAAGAASSTVWDKVYTADQAKRGEAVYAQQCASCHKADLLGDGDYAGPLIGPQFIGKWNQKPLADLFEKIRTTMPANNPDALPAKEYADVLSYLLSTSEFPAGQTELPADLAKLRMITLVDTAPK